MVLEKEQGRALQRDMPKENDLEKEMGKLKGLNLEK
jgi:hypothetical protein